MRLVDFDIHAFGFFIVRDENCVDVFVKLAGYVVRHIQQGLG